MALPINKYPEFSTAHGQMPGANTSESIWVQVIAEDGTWGLGETSFGEITASIVDYHFAPLLDGRDCFALEFLNDLMWRSTQRFGAGGLATVAQSGIDLALWDLKGKLMQQPVYTLLGGPVRKSISCYATSDDIDWSKELGFTKFKISNPAHYIEGDSGIREVITHVDNARKIIGFDQDLMINPVMSYNVEFALRLLNKIKPYSLRWVEEPLIPTNIEGLAEIRKKAPWIAIADLCVLVPLGTTTPPVPLK